MGTAWDSILRTQLLDRRERLRAAMPQAGEEVHLVSLLQEVDSALERIDLGSYGICAVCHGVIEEDRLLADPLVRTCLECLSPNERHALQQDLVLASRIQSGLLPHSRNFAGWEVCFHYEPAGPVSGDYCDLVNDDSEPGSFYFMLGDVSGKGVAASLLMSHLHAIFRSLIAMNLPVQSLMQHANRVFAESTVSTHYATLVCGRASHSGELEICNAGHCPPLVLHKGSVECAEPTGMPIGLFSNAEHTTRRFQLSDGDTVILYTDGLSEANDCTDSMYGAERLAQFIARQNGLALQALINACLDDVAVFRAGAPLRDDLTVMAIRRVPQPMA